MDEKRLLELLRERDERAFEEMVKLYQHRVFNVVYRMLGNAHEAEDVAQEVFVTVFKSIESFREEAKFSTWLYRIATNHCKNRIKYLGRRAHGRTDELDENTPESQSTGPSASLSPRQMQPDAVVEGMQLERLVQEGIAHLDEEQRIVLVLRDVEELSYDEIAQITGLADGTVKSRLHRARLELRDYLQKRTGGMR